MPNYISLTEAIARLPHLNRVLVIGCSGGGKTTLSHNISTTSDLEYLSLDRDVRWLPGWRERDRSEQRAIISRLIKKDRWVFDGSGASTFDLRLPRTDLIIWVRVPRHVALFGLSRRIISNYRKVRPFMPDGCPEKFPDREFLSYIWNFEKRYAPRFVKSIDLYGPTIPVAILKSRAEICNLLKPIGDD